MWKARVASPLTPDPSPLPGARGVRCDFHCSLKTQIPPLAPVKRGRGVGGEGAISPEPCPSFWPHSGSMGGRGSCRAPLLIVQTPCGSAGASPSRRVPQSRHNSVSNRCHVAAPCKLRTAHRLPHGRGSWLTAWSMGAHVETRGTFTPHPRPLSPSRQAVDLVDFRRT